MANWNKNPPFVDIENINTNNKFEAADGITYRDMNTIVENLQNLKNTSVILGKDKFDKSGGTISGNVIITGGLTVGGQLVATRDSSSKFKDADLVKWDATNQKFVDAGQSVDSLIKLNALTEAKLNENIIKDPSKTYLVWKGNSFPNSNYAAFKAPAGCTIDWGDGIIETFEAGSTAVNTHTYTDGIEYHLISLSKYTVIDSGSFAGCSGLISVTIGNGVTSIVNDAFNSCDELTSIIIPVSVTSIRDYAFTSCSGLKTIKVLSTTPPTLGSEVFYTTIEKIIVPKSAINSYKSADEWSTYADKIVYEVDSSDLDAAVTNLENGTGNKSIQQVKNTNGTTIPIKTKNPNAVTQGAPEEVEIGATGESAAVFGGAAAATAKRAFAAGTNTAALGKYSAAFGDNSVALGNESFAANSVTTASGQGASAFGNSTIASGYNSFAEGNATVASGQVSHAAGTGTKATSNNQFVIGAYNNIDENQIFIVGVGSSDKNRRNGFTVNKDGIAYMGGDKVTTENVVIDKCNIVLTAAQGYTDLLIGQLNTTIKQNIITYKLNVGGNDNNNVVSEGASAAIGIGLNTNAYAQTVLGRYNNPNADAFFIVGNGAPGNIQNAFEVLFDGRAKVQTAPKDNNDVVRKLELDNLNARYVSTSILGG